MKRRVGAPRAGTLLGSRAHARSVAVALACAQMRSSGWVTSPVTIVFDETRSTDAAARAVLRHDRWLAMLRADATAPEVARLRYDRLMNADITDPARAWIAEALAAGAASGDLNESAVRAAFEHENSDRLARSAFAQVYEHVAGRRVQEEAAA